MIIRKIHWKLLLIKCNTASILKKYEELRIFIHEGSIFMNKIIFIIIFNVVKFQVLITNTVPS